jgi:hypothetical protein
MIRQMFDNDTNPSRPTLPRSRKLTKSVANSYIQFTPQRVTSKLHPPILAQHAHSIPHPRAHGFPSTLTHIVPGNCCSQEVQSRWVLDSPLSWKQTLWLRAQEF